MKVKCIKVEGYQFSRKDVREGITNRVVHNALTKNKNYTVYGILMFEEGVDYLIFDDYEMPMWYSADLFEVENTILPSNWHYNFFGYEEFGITAIWGYIELVKSQKYFDGLAEQNEEDVKIFMKYKDELSSK